MDHMQKNRRLVVSVIIVLLALALTGCGAAAEKNPEKEAAEYRQEQEDNLGFPFLREVPQYAQASARPVADSFAGGSGTEEDPYQIDNAEQLELLSRISNASPKDETYDYDMQSACKKAHYILTSDIIWNDTADFDNWDKQAPLYAWEPICKRDSFQGVFDGAGHTISGLYIISIWEPTPLHMGTESSEPAFGLFGFISGENAAVRNLNLADSFYQLYNVSYNAGSIAGKLTNGTISNCTADVNIRCDAGRNIGGVVGSASNVKIEGCTFSGTISGEHVLYNLGGITADSSGGVFTDCINDGILYPLENTQEMGGLIGQLTDTTDSIILNQEDMTFHTESKQVRTTTLLDGCINNTSLKTTGGLVGNLQAFRSDVVIRNCQNHGDIEACGGTGAGLIGRITGYGDGDGFDSVVRVEGCVNTGNITGETQDSIGGLIGVAAYQKNASLTVTNCRNSGSINGNSQTGGILGSAVAYGACNISLNTCENSGAVTAQQGSGGGIAGAMCFAYSGTDRYFSISESCNAGDIAGNGYGIGGILGTSLHHDGCAGDTITLNACENTGMVSGHITSILGGIAGYLPSGEDSITVTNCHGSGVVRLEKNADWSDSSDETVFAAVGGIVGAARNTVRIDGCTFEGNTEIDPLLTPYTAISNTAIYFDDTVLMFPCTFDSLNIIK